MKNPNNEAIIKPDSVEMVNLPNSIPTMSIEQTKSMIDGIMSGINKDKDTREAILSELTKMAYEKEKLNMLTRLNPDRTEHLTRNYLLDAFFSQYYSKCKTVNTFIKIIQKEDCICKNINLDIKKCPLCKGKGKFKNETYKISSSTTRFEKEDMEKLIKKYPDMLDMLKELFVADNGLGRREIFEFMKSLNSVGDMAKRTLPFFGGGGMRV